MKMLVLLGAGSHIGKHKRYSLTTSVFRDQVACFEPAQHKQSLKLMLCCTKNNYSIKKKKKVFYNTWTLEHLNVKEKYLDAEFVDSCILYSLSSLLAYRQKSRSNSSYFYSTAIQEACLSGFFNPVPLKLIVWKIPKSYRFSTGLATKKIKLKKNLKSGSWKTLH